MTPSRITVLGGTGFVGQQVVLRLAAQAHQVSVLTRHQHRARNLQVHPEVKLIECRVHDPEVLAERFQGSDAVINLVGILNTAGTRTENQFQGAHEALTASVVNACREAGVRRYLHMSALGADAERGRSDYQRTKGEAEQHVRATADRLDWTIFRPSIIFGPGDDFFNRFATLLRLAPALPLACPDARFSPVYVGDVADTMVSALHDSTTYGQIMHLCGPDDATLQELVEYTRSLSGLSTPILRLPDAVARVQARVMEWVPGKPFSRDNYASLQTDNICPEGCPRQRTSLSAIVPDYIGQHDRNGLRQLNRSLARRQ